MVTFTKRDLEELEFVMDFYTKNGNREIGDLSYSVTSKIALLKDEKIQEQSSKEVQE